MKEKINQEINNFFGNFDNKILQKHYETIKNYINIGGKRIRPMACVMAYNSIKGEDEKIFLPAIGIEFFHNSTLCHDDIIDEDEKRRNEKSCHKSYQQDYLDANEEKEYRGDIFSKESMRFGAGQAILAGNIFTFLGYSTFNNSGFSDELKNKAISRMTEVMIEVNHGQILDVSYEKKECDEKGYLDMISKKTAMLLGVSFEMGCIFADGDDDTRKAFFDFGFNLGIAFQITDDLMDVDKDSKKGNTFGSDIVKGKNTILMIKAKEKVKDIDVSDVENVVKIFEETGAIDYAKKLAADKIESAKESLDSINMDEEYKAYFLELADFMVERKV